MPAEITPNTEFDIQEEPLHISARSLKELKFPLDKVNSTVFDSSVLEALGLQKAGVMLNTANKKEKTEKKKKIYILYTITLASNTPKDLTSYDKRLMMVIDALARAQNQCMTLQQIYHYMGGKGTASEEQKQNIRNAIDRLRHAVVELDNKAEAGFYNYPLVDKQEVFLNCQYRKLSINGMEAEGLQLLSFPLLMRFAIDRVQFEQIPCELYNIPDMRLTEANIALQDYLISRISHMNHGKTIKKIRFTTICEKAHINTAMQQTRAKNKIRKILNHYKACHWIEAYTELPDGIGIVRPPKQP